MNVEVICGTILLLAGPVLYTAGLIKDEATVAIIMAAGGALVRSGRVDQVKVRELRQQTEALEQQTELMRCRERRNWQ